MHICSLVIVKTLRKIQYYFLRFPPPDEHSTLPAICIDVHYIIINIHAC